ncbi:MAG TPA: helix-turn-helix domain-containing protein [Trebonia sp.]|nr:helix-turn-helix domain-containing protein [Trebonia sp.]
MLDGLGLNGEQEAVYVALVDVSSATLAELSPRCPGVPVGQVLADLERAGLVSRLADSPAAGVAYAAAPPDMALELLARAREQELARARLSVSRLDARYRQARVSGGPHEVIEVVTTREATVRRWEQLQRSAREQVRSFDRPPYVAQSPDANPVEEEMLASGVAYRCVYHPAGLALPGRPAAMRGMIAAGEQARVTESVPVKMFIADERMGLIPLEVGGSAEASLIIRASSMLDTLIALFELVWERAIPIHGDGDLPPSGTGPGADDAALLGLLAAGLTDAAIARHLGTHPRTVQRRVRDLLDRLDAGTRFQAGIQAVRRGWL